jgi:hypothetical protein
MIKIEQLKNGAKATIVRNGFKQPVYLAMNITEAELLTLEITGGSLVYTVDETEIVEVMGGDAVVAPTKSVEDIANTEQSAATVETPVEEIKTPVVKPAIVKPAPRAKK